MKKFTIFVELVALVILAIICQKLASGFLDDMETNSRLKDGLRQSVSGLSEFGFPKYIKKFAKILAPGKTGSDLAPGPYGTPQLAAQGVNRGPGGYGFEQAPMHNVRGALPSGYEYGGLDQNQGIGRPMLNPAVGKVGQGVNNQMNNGGLPGQGVNNQMNNGGLPGQGVNNQMNNGGLPGQGVNNQMNNGGWVGQGVNNQPNNGGWVGQGVNNQMNNGGWVGQGALTQRRPASNK